MYLDAVIHRNSRSVVFNAPVADVCNFVLRMNPEQDDAHYVVPGVSLTPMTPIEYLQMHNLTREKMFTLDEVIQGLKEGRSFKREFDDGGFEMVRSLKDGHLFEHTVAGNDHGGFAELDISVIDEKRWGTKLWEEMS